jgi:uncharacterized repeat protein (TIGR03806 family)
MVAISAVLCACTDIEKAVPDVSQFTKESFPRYLSAWGVLYRQDKDLVLNEGVIAYDLNTPLYTDYAHKLRTFWIPPSRQITYTEDTDLDLPLGSIVTKTFYYPVQDGELISTEDYSRDFSTRGLNLQQVKLIETRVLVRLSDGWHGLPYVWNAEQTDAELEITGAVKALSLQKDSVPTNFSYIVPDANQCQSCHVDDMTSKQMRLLGMKARHVNKAYAGFFVANNQLQHWHDLGKLEQLPNKSIANVDWRDATKPLDDRAYAYLDVNCGHCHNPVGPADTSGLFLNTGAMQHNEYNLLRLGVCKPPVAAGQGTGGRKVGIQPGNAVESILSYRMESLDLGAMMPELGRSLVHEEGVTLINEWINAMPGSCQ